MKNVTIPGTDLRVSAICLGTGDLGGAVSVSESFTLLDEFVALGGNFLDTAHVYSDWIPGTKSSSEKTIGQWLRTRGSRDRVIVATKGAHPDLATMHIPRLSRADIIQDLNESLEYLGTDYIDLYWLHRDDLATPVGDILDTLNDQVRAGKIRAFGCSNWKPGRIQEALDEAAKRGQLSFVANQPMWSLAAADLEALPDKTLVNMDSAGWQFHRRTGLAAVPYSSQAQGFFSKLETGGLEALPSALKRQYGSQANLERFRRAQNLARQHSVSTNQIALAYLLAQPFVTVPIVGCKTVDHLRDSIQAANVRLTPEQVAYLENGGGTNV